MNSLSFSRSLINAAADLVEMTDAYADAIKTGKRAKSMNDRRVEDLLRTTYANLYHRLRDLMTKHALDATSNIDWNSLMSLANVEVMNRELVRVRHIEERKRMQQERMEYEAFLQTENLAA